MWPVYALLYVLAAPLVAFFFGVFCLGLIALFSLQDHQTDVLNIATNNRGVLKGHHKALLAQQDLFLSRLPERHHSMQGPLQSNFRDLEIFRQWPLSQIFIPKGCL